MAEPAPAHRDPEIGPLETELPVAEIRAAVVGWYGRRGRPLAFRRTRDPYHVLVLETMAQQTQIARAAEHWARFVDRFPTFEALAAAAPADAVEAWRGLGYNRRAIHLWRTARLVVTEHGGRLPSDPTALERLPGVGPYTARAVAATAFGRRVGAVDTNVRRALGRMAAGEAPISMSSLQAVADTLVPPDDPAGWTHALMDLGATVCLPRNPACADCPLEPWCRFAADRRAAPSSVPGRRTRATPAAPAAAPFRATTRWLRGRLLDRLRDGARVDGGWVTFDGPIGQHPPASIVAALAGLERDGLVERRAGSPLEARLPQA